MSKVKSFIIWAVFVAGTGAASTALWYALLDPKFRTHQSLHGWYACALLFGLMFGTMGWLLLTTPTEVTPNTGWKRFRPLMWWVVIALGMEGIFLYSGKPFRWDDLTATFCVGAVITFVGWSMAHMRAERAGYFIKQSRTEFLSSFSE